MIIKKPCPHCKKQTDIKSQFSFGTTSVITYACGHSVTEKVFDPSKDWKAEIERFSSLVKAKKPFNYQKDGISLVFKSNGRCLIADEMGLGKTMQSCVPIALEKEEFLPVVIVCKSVAKANWFRELADWGHVPAQTITSSKDIWHKMFKAHIVSYDLLTRLMKDNSKKDFNEIRSRCKYVILDETHLIKNEESLRAKAVKKFTGGDSKYDKEGNLLFEYSEIPHIVGLSGTPIVNNASEFFTILNILYPKIFWEYTRFCRSYVKSVWNGKSWKLGGLADPESFLSMISPYFIRRTMDDVLPDLPKLWRHNNFYDLEGDVADLYGREQAEFIKYFEEEKADRNFAGNVIAKLSRLRHLTSLAKIDMTIDKVMEFLFSTSGRKLAIFVHHLDTRDILADKLNAYFKEAGMPSALVLSAKDKDLVQNELDAFKTSDRRVVILSTQSHGESLNLQFLSDSILHERQWNPAKEDQAISGRFRRIGQDAERINCTIQIAVGTIDEWFAELVEFKRQNVGESLGDFEVGESQWNETSIMMELAEMIAKKGKKWVLN